MLNIFVAGGTGVLGRPTVQALVEAGHQVRATARGKEKAAWLRRMGADPVELDLYDAQALRRAIAGSDAVLRLTTKIPPMAKVRQGSAWAENNRLRTEGARMLVDGCIAERIPVYVSESITFVYADGGEQWLTEEAPVDGSGEILSAALRGEEETLRFTASGGRGIILRFAAFYSPDAPSTTDTVHLLRKRMFPQAGPGQTFFSSIYVPDAAQAVVAVLSAPAGTYNVCDDEPVRLREYLQIAAEAVGAPRSLRLPEFVSKLMLGKAGSYLSRSQRISNASLKQATGWKPSVRSVREGWPLIAEELKRKSVTNQGTQAA
jgi:nucleoside-diphosphate-sugar epimerase